MRCTGAGFGGGLLLAVRLDAGGRQRSAIGQWIVWTAAGEGESLVEGVYALRQSLLGSARSMADASGWAKLLGMAVPWIIDSGSRLLGITAYGIEGLTSFVSTP